MSYEDLRAKRLEELSQNGQLSSDTLIEAERIIKNEFDAIQAKVGDLAIGGAIGVGILRKGGNVAAQKANLTRTMDKK